MWTIHPVSDADGQLIDLVAECDSRQIALLGAGGAARELALFSAPDTAHALAAERGLPVLIGSGMGHALDELIARTNGPIAVVDADPAALALTKLSQRAAPSRVTWFCVDRHEPDSLNIITRKLTIWQKCHAYKPLIPLVNPWYLRLDRTWYASLRKTLEASARYDFWSKAVQPRFRNAIPRLLLITSKYFLMGELQSACTYLGFPVQFLTITDQEQAQEDFVRRLLSAVLEFRPDCVLTLNHLGIDREGVLVNLLEQLQLPLASWFVDNPNLILHLYAGLTSPWTTIFTWDADNIEGLERQGFPHVRHLPLGTDPKRFCPQTGQSAPSSLPRPNVSFVGNSMVFKVGARLKKTDLPASVLRGYRAVATDFAASSERSVRTFIDSRPALAMAYHALPELEDRLAFETLLTWEATRQYRLSCVEQIMPFAPLIVGDKGWEILFRQRTEPWCLHPEVNYYNTLPHIYRLSAINFNCTSQQMKGAVNQRVFDVPAVGAFVLTDWREQIDTLFEPGKEVICYHAPEEVPDLVRYYLAHPKERQQVAMAARKRVLAEHTWANRVQHIVKVMKDIYG